MEKPHGSVFCYVSGHLYSILNTGGVNWDGGNNKEMKNRVKKAKPKNVDLKKKKKLLHKLDFSLYDKHFSCVTGII